jgi:hypothetical protein
MALSPMNRAATINEKDWIPDQVGNDRGNKELPRFARNDMALSPMNQASQMTKGVPFPYTFFITL